MVNLRLCAFRSGKKISELQSILSAVKESDRASFIEKNLPIYEKDLTLNFIKSGYSNYVDFLESLIDVDPLQEIETGGMVTSGGFAVGDKPENALSVDKIRKGIEDKEKEDK